jgi:hypothetical protein
VKSGIDWLEQYNDIHTYILLGKNRIILSSKDLFEVQGFNQSIKMIQISNDNHLDGVNDNITSTRKSIINAERVLVFIFILNRT